MPGPPRSSVLHPLFARPCVDVCGPWSNGRFVNLYFALRETIGLTWFRWLLLWLRVSVPCCCALESTYCAHVSERTRTAMQRSDISSTRDDTRFRDLIFFLLFCSFCFFGEFNREWLIFGNLDVLSMSMRVE